jgi:hypothetical protein
LGGQLNFQVGDRSVDIAVTDRNVKIAVEYDSWFWHADQIEEDRERDNHSIASGWRVLRIKSNNLLPSLEHLQQTIGILLSGELAAEITLDDWGKGPTVFREVADRSIVSRRPAPISSARVLDGSPEEFLGELDRRSLYLRRGDVDAAKLTLTPQEATLFQKAMGKGHSPSTLVFTSRSVRQSLGNPELQDGAIRTAMGRLRKLVTFSGALSVGLISRITKGQYKTQIRIAYRPDERRRDTVQTACNEWRPFEEARAFVRNLGLRRQRDWYAYAKSKMPQVGTRPPDIPWNPQRTYKDKGWNDWRDWLIPQRQEPLFAWLDSVALNEIPVRQSWTN